MRTLFFAFALSCLIIPSSHAEDYIIRNMNIPQIRIGSDTCKIGSIFSDKSKIYWGNGNGEIIEAENKNTGRTWRFTKKDLSRNNSSTIEQFCNWVKSKWKDLTSYIFDQNLLSTREIRYYNIDEVLTDDFMLVDTIKVRLNEDLKDIEYYGSFIYNGERKIVKLTTEDDYLVITRDQLPHNDVELPYTMVLTIFYKKGDMYQEVTDGMCIMIVKPSISNEPFKYNVTYN